jgi:rhodanese-related sulfurtransferase
MGLFNQLFGGGNKIQEYLEKGAVVIDVRSPQEYQSGHVEGSRNIPLNSIGNKIKEIQRYKKPVIFCCASGMRSGQATSMLKSEGVDCINGGSWTRVLNASKATA